MTTSFKVGEIEISTTGPLFLIAGPCVIEDRPGHALELAQRIAEICLAEQMPFIFKASYDKANRTSISSYRGPGLEKGCEVLADIKAQLGVPLLTDIHEPSQAARVAAYGVDILQIPAFLCRQTDLLVAAAETGQAVNIKKGQFVDPGALGSAVEKVRGSGNSRIMLTERGSSFGYHLLVNDMRAIQIMGDFGVPVVYDATHSAQHPPTGGPVTGGDRKFVPLLSRAAVAAGCHGVFLEVHEDPDSAPSDSQNMLQLDQLAPLLRQLKRIHSAVSPEPSSS